MRLSLFSVMLLSVTLVTLCVRAADNELTDKEKADGWISLFDGKTTAGWMCGTKPMPQKQVENGTINTLKQGAYVAHFDRKLTDYTFACDFKFDKDCNSGVFIHISKPGDGGIGRGIEIQVFDSFGKAKPDKHDCGAMYDLLEPSANAVKKAGEWNHMEITSEGSHVKVSLNGQNVLDANLDDWAKPSLNPDGTKHKFAWAFKDQPREGYVGLQDHGHACWYKNLKVRPATPDKR